jgi:hypothetical protein
MPLIDLGPAPKTTKEPELIDLGPAPEPITREPNVYDGLSPDEAYKKAGEVWDAAVDSDIDIADVEFYPAILNDPQSLAPRKEQEVRAGSPLIDSSAMAQYGYSRRVQNTLYRKKAISIRGPTD